MKLNIPEIKIPKVKMPKVNIPKPRRRAEHAAPAPDDIPDELEYTSGAEAEPVQRPQEKIKSYGMVISEDQLRMVWAGEIGFSLLIVFASVLIAIAG